MKIRNLVELKLLEYEGRLRSLEKIFKKGGSKLKKESSPTFKAGEVIVISSDDEQGRVNSPASVEPIGKNSPKVDKGKEANTDYGDDCVVVIEPSVCPPNDCTNGNTSPSASSGKKKKKKSKKRKRESVDSSLLNGSVVSSDSESSKKKKSKKKRRASSAAETNETTDNVLDIDVESLRRKLFVEKLIEVILPDVLAEQQKKGLSGSKKRRTV